MQAETLKVPKERLGALIGDGGKTKRAIEKATKSKVFIDSENGEIEVTAKENIDEIKAMDIVKAIARGFAPSKALLLANEEFTLRVLSLRELVGKSEKAIQQKKARVIGRKGAVRAKIEKETNCYISVYGNTVAIIGEMGDIAFAEEAVEMLLEGANVSTVYERIRKRKLMERKFEL